MLNWGNQFNICCFMDSHDYEDAYGRYELLLACNALRELKCEEQFVPSLQSFAEAANDWVFGHLNFEAGYELVGLKDGRKPTTFPYYYFFVPETIITLKGLDLTIHTTLGNCEQVLADIIKMPVDNAHTHAPVSLQPSIAKDVYLHAIAKLKQHIQRGDCYEINYCQRFFNSNAAINPLLVYGSLSKVSPAPFSVFYKVDESYLLCASPERFVQKEDKHLISQPIKGTARRDLQNPANDEVLRLQLSNSAKDRSENVMIVDLVRNDLSKIATTGSVHVKELFGIKAFPQVFQMISTIGATVEAQLSAAQVMAALFPMGSMTGAPKRRVMELTAAYEPDARGIYSGTVGYIDPAGNMDFNVVIRSIIYDAAKHLVECYAGGGITWYSKAEDEYEESLLKAGAMLKVLQGE